MDKVCLFVVEKFSFNADNGEPERCDQCRGEGVDRNETANQCSEELHVVSSGQGGATRKRSSTSSFRYKKYTREELNSMALMKLIRVRDKYNCQLRKAKTKSVRYKLGWELKKVNLELTKRDVQVQESETE